MARTRKHRSQISWRFAAHIGLA